MQSQAARDQLARWGITQEIAQANGLFETDNVQRVYPNMRAEPGIIIPYYDAAGNFLTFKHGDEVKPFARVRWLDPAPGPGKGFVKPRPMRYTQPPQTGPQVYFPPGIDWRAVQADVRQPVIVTEGEAKAIVAASHGFVTLALGGVYSFANTSGALLPALTEFEWTQRHVYVAYDSDASNNPNVRGAEARLVRELQTVRQAHCHLVRLPAPGDAKVGLDDFINEHGPEALETLLQESPNLSGLESKIIAFNERYAWIMHENMVFDRETKLLRRKSEFTVGDDSSTVVHVTVNSKGERKDVPVAPKWLTHPHAQRYNELLFRPSGPIMVDGENGPALNIWDGFKPAIVGTVDPWLRLDEYLFQDLQPELRDFPRKLLAYKLQNPEKKVPIALMLLGDQGSGKTVWTDSVIEAAAPYGKVFNPRSLDSEFQEWTERAILAAVHEMTPQAMYKHSEKLKSMVSDLRQPMNAKYRPVRDINSYAMYILTSNLRGVSALPQDDRRYFVADLPGHGPEDMYVDMWRWKDDQDGPRKLLNYFLSYDLKGWVPPQRAPDTAAKQQGYKDGLSVIQELADEMRNSDQHAIVSWLDAAALWAQSAELSSNSMVASHAREVAMNIKAFQIRPWYTPEELSLMFPVVIEMIMGVKHRATTPPGEIARQLRDAGIRYLINPDDTRGFWWRGQWRQYLVVSDPDEWGVPIRQADFERHMHNWPTYSQFKHQQARRS